MRIQALALAAVLTALAACDKPAAPPPAATEAAADASGLPMPTVPEGATIKDIMASTIDPSGDFMFESVVDISDDKGISRKEPKTDAEWAVVRHHLMVLDKGADLLTAPGIRGARPEQRAAFPQVELQPEEVNQLLDTDRPAFLRRVATFKAAVAVATKAAEAKNSNALITSLVGIDHGCEGCHLQYWYPKDERAKQAAKEEGVE